MDYIPCRSGGLLCRYNYYRFLFDWILFPFWLPSWFWVIWGMIWGEGTERWAEEDICHICWFSVAQQTSPAGVAAQSPPVRSLVRWLWGRCVDRWVAIWVLGSDVSWGTVMTRWAVTQLLFLLKLADGCKKTQNNKTAEPSGEMSGGPGTDCSEELGPWLTYSFFCWTHISQVSSLVFCGEMDSVGWK